MELGLGNTLLAGDPRLVDHIVGEVKSQGIFDQFRKECIADVDTKPAYQNLRTRVESSVNSFLGKQTWKADLNKNQLRETLRKHIHEASYLDAGVERIVDQVVNPKVYSVFMPQIEDVVYKFLGIERPKHRERNGACGFKDLLPKDLDPVSPESDKNSLKDVSLDSVDANINDSDVKDKDLSVANEEQNKTVENEGEKDNTNNGQFNDDEKSLDGASKVCSATATNSNLNNSGKSEDKGEEEEEDSPTFEPIDIMNLNESNISNDSHLSGISELTSHRSRSPDFSNEASRDNMDFSNQDSQFSKVSSDSRLSIVTDFGSSNHGSTSHSDAVKDDNCRDKNDSKYVKDNFKAVREFESSKSRDGRLSYESSASKENTAVDSKNLRRSMSSKETSRDGTETAIKDSRESKEKSKDGETAKCKIKDRNEAQDSKKEKDRESRKKQMSRGDAKTEKSSRSKGKDKADSNEKSRDKDLSIKPKEDKVKDAETKDSSVTKEGKDLKDIYKEKIRELREKKELTEKEKLSKDSKDIKLSKDTKEKRDSSRDKRDSKDYKGSSSKTNNSSRSDNKTSKSSEKDSKTSRNESKDKGKREERRYSKEHKSRSNETGEKSDLKRASKSDDKIEKSDVKQEGKTNTQKSVGKRDSRDNSRSKSVDNKRDSKAEIDAKDKKRREEKKGKTKDDHSSLRKNSDDRRSTDRDGSNGSNGRSSQKSNSSSGTSSAKPVSSSLSKESTNTSNSSSETSDSIEELQHEKLKISIDHKTSEIIRNSKHNDLSLYLEEDSNAKRLDLGSSEISLPIKKRPLLNESNNSGDIYIKKPKFAKNFHEAKKLMKIRRKIEKRMLKAQLEIERNTESSSSAETVLNVVKNDVQSVPDDERVQIIEVCDEEYDEPYPEIQSDFTLEERSQIILGGEPLFASDLIAKEFNAKSKLSEMELSIRQSLNEMISDKIVDDKSHVPKNVQDSTEEETELKVKESLNTNAKSLISEIVKNEREKSRTLSEQMTKSEDTANITEPSTSSLETVNSKNSDVQHDSASRDKIPCKSEDLAKTEEQGDFKIEKGNVQLSEAELKLKSEIIDVKDENIEPSDTKESTNPIDESIIVSESSRTKIESLVETGSTSVNIGRKIDVSSVQSSDDEEPCLYLTEDNERLEKFMKFMRILEANESLKAEQCGEISSEKIESSSSKTMAPPQPKRKYSTSPLIDILLNSTNNNNDAQKITATIPEVEDTLNNTKKRKIGRPKKQISTASPCSQQNLLNGENFVMPLSPESDVSATSEKTPSNPIKDEKSKPRGSNQRYTSDDLYKPRPLFSSSSRRSRRSNQA